MSHLDAASEAHAVERRNCQFLQRSRADIWGPPPEPPRVPAVNEAEGWISSLFFRWCNPLLEKARKGGLCIGPLYDIAYSDRAWVVGDKLSANIFQEHDRLKRWDGVIGVTDAVIHRKDPTSRGTLRWVGCMEMSQDPKKLHAGVEWRVPPKHYCEAAEKRRVEETLPLLASSSEGSLGARTGAQHKNDVSPFHNGTFRGERLFVAETGLATCEEIHQVLVVAGQEGVHPQSPSLLRAFMHAFGSYHSKCIGWYVVHELCVFLYPAVLEYFIAQLSPSHDEQGSARWKVLLCVLAFCCISAAITLCRHRAVSITSHTGLRWASAVSAALFAKTFLISKQALAHPQYSSGRVITMLTSDAEQLNSMCSWSLQLTVTCPLELVVFLVLLYRVVGWPVVGGVAVFLLLTPLQACIARKIDTTREALVKVTDARMKATDELLKGIRIVKFMGWEEQFVASVSKLREEEIEKQGIRIVKFMGWEEQFVASVSKLREEEIEKQRQLHWYRTVTTFVAVSASPVGS